MDAEQPACIQGIARLVRMPPCPHQQEEIALMLLPKKVLPGVLDRPWYPAYQESAPLGERRHEGHRTDTAPLLRGEEHAGIARMHRESQHAPAEIGDGSRGLHVALPGRAGIRCILIPPLPGRATSDRPQVRQQSLRDLQRLRFRRLDPWKGRDIHDARRLQRQNDLGQVQAAHLGQFAKLPHAVLLLGP
jgi:hypothetical protein